MLNNYLVKIFQKVFSKTIGLVLLEYYPLLIIRATNLSLIPMLLSLLKHSSVFRLNTLVELTATDQPTHRLRFMCNFFLLSIEYNYRLAININFDQADFVPSLSSVFINSSWSEREARDMFGIYFSNNVDLRRLLTDYGFTGFPLRKDFPLTGFFEVRYEDEVQQILYEPVQLSQEFRLFSLNSPWEKKV